MKVFITGIAGFLGSHLADAMLSMGHEVLGCDNMMRGSEDNVPKNAKCFLVDCTDYRSMSDIMGDVEILYHCAAYPYEGLSVISPCIVNESIYQATSGVLSAFIQNEGKRFVYLSSMSRYGTNQIPFTEDMETRPQDPYALSKVSSEELIKLMSRIYGFEYSIAVPHNIVGPRQKYDDPFAGVLPIFANRMLQGKQPVIYGDGSQKRCFSFVSDCIEPLKKMGFQKNAVSEIINIGPDEEFVTIYELAEIIADSIDFRLDPIFLPDRPQEVKEANCSADKSRRLLGYRTTYMLEKGIKEIVEWIKKKGPKPFEYKFTLEIVNHMTPKSWLERLI